MKGAVPRGFCFHPGHPCQRHLLTLFSLGGGGGHIVPALTLTKYNFLTARRIITKSRAFFLKIITEHFGVSMTCLGLLTFP